MIELPGMWSLTPLGFGLGVVTLMYWLIATGRLVPRHTHERELRAANVRGDEWKETAFAERTLNGKLLEQNTDLLEGARTMKAVVQSAAPPLDEDTLTGGA